MAGDRCSEIGPCRGMEESQSCSGSTRKSSGMNGNMGNERGSGWL